MKKIDLGCGSSKKEGFLGVDCLNLAGVDIVHDLSSFPYPFETNEVDEIYMDNVLEHLQSPVRVIEELYRISKPNAKITISVPYFRSSYAFIDPTHVNFLGIHWFDYFDPNHRFNKKYAYSHASFEIVRKEFDIEWKKMGRKGLLRSILVKFADKKPELYEHHLSHLFPLDSITFELKVIK